MFQKAGRIALLYQVVPLAMKTHLNLIQYMVVRMRMPVTTIQMQHGMMVHVNMLKRILIVMATALLMLIALVNVVVMQLLMSVVSVAVMVLMRVSVTVLVT